MAGTTAVNTFSLREGVGAAEFAAFSRDLDRPTCLALAEVESFDVYLVDHDRDGSAVDVVEVMTVTDWDRWVEVRDSAPQLRPVVDRFEQLVDIATVTTYFTRRTTGEEA
ncbi:REDY-like protein HapK [Jatrophihabitans endophyticus]|uniref:REDY-like protein HapK n=1 Tax=Jatrophihabitans endophyticus TaxID=1206085 RepID=A0A1M5S349_9ACTN|nr:hypothetical protein [Jatrophihabitans endophyticus]SHH32919.1 REDY-like protein HapK [Jatrophihabitans endophyticus]